MNFASRRLSLMFLCLLVLAPLTRAETPEKAAAAEKSAQVQLTYTDAVLLGLIEGVTEFLPVSSTGHLVLANGVLGLDDATPLVDATGAPVVDGDGEAYTVARAANAYVIVIQAGAIAAVLLLYRRRVWGVVRGFLGRDRDGLRLGINLLVAFLPAAVLGLLLDDWIEARLFGPYPIAFALAAGGLLMLGVERWRRQRTQVANEGPELHELSLSQCLLIGLLQCVAMWPGTSRSMMTIVGGYLAGLRPALAAEFSFLLGLITLSAAAGYKAVSEGPSMLQVLDAGPVLVGCVVALVSAAVSVRWLVGYLTRHGLGLFAWYRIALALAVVVFAV